MHKPIYLRQAIIDLSKIIMYEFRCNYIKLKYGKNLWLYYMDTSSLVYDIKTDNFHEYIARDVQARVDMSGYSRSRPPPMGVNKKVIGLMKDKLGRGVMTEIMALRPKLYVYKTLSEWGQESPGSQEVRCEKDVRLENHKQCLFAGRNASQKQLSFQNKLHEVHTVEANKLALSIIMTCGSSKVMA